MRYVIGIDFGGTKISGSIISHSGKIIDSIRHPTESEKGANHVINNIVAIVHNLRKNTKKKIEGVGISMPGFLDKTGKVIFGGGTLKCLIGINLKKVLQKKTGLRVEIDNDANCFALAEATFGAGKGYNNVLGIIWGTGVGSGIVIDKTVIKGAIGAAGEFGHIVINPSLMSGPKCGCGQYGCIENLCSGKNIVRIYKSMGGKLKDPHAGDIYKSKEAVAKKVINEAVENLGLGIASIVTTINPEIIVLGGGVSKLPNTVYTQLKKEVKKHVMPILTKNLKIVRHKISDDAGILGAAALIFN